MRSCSIEILDTVCSTNDFILEKIKQSIDLPLDYAVLAREQTTGKGRNGKRWVSPYGENVYLSVYSSFSGRLEKITGLSLVAGISVVEALENFGIKNVKLKWPNDIYFDNKKLGGILVETVCDKHHTKVHIVTGIGINISKSGKYKNLVDQNITDLELISGEKISRLELSKCIVSRYRKFLEKFFKHGFINFLDIWSRFDFLKGKTVKIKENNIIHSGKVIGVDQTGALLLQDQKINQIKKIINGSISVSMPIPEL